MKTECHSKLEPVILAHVCEPVARRVPAWVRPNDITVATAVLSWVAFVACVVAPHLDPAGALGARVLAGAAAFLAMLTDCVDGMHARRTGQCSPRGEVLDHWLDTVHVPLAAAGLLLTLGLEGWLVALAMVTNVAVYEAQLVLYHHSGRFVHPPTAGTEAQLGVALVHVALGLGFFLLPEDAAAVRNVGAGIVALGVVVQLRALGFYFRRLGSLIWRHWAFVGVSLVPSLAYLEGHASAVAYMLMMTALSLRVTGTYVLRTVAGRSYAGMDAGSLGAVAVWTALVVAQQSLGAAWHWAGLGAWTVIAALAASALAELGLRWAALAPKDVPRSSR